MWSGDLASSGGADDRFIVPEEGCLIWTDNMMIPKGAANKYTAELMMDFVYDPKVAAQIANYVYYVSPVKGVDEAIKKLDPEAATNPLLFPTPDDRREAAQLPGAQRRAGDLAQRRCTRIFPAPRTERAMTR